MDMDWIQISNQEELDTLTESVCWDDSSTCDWAMTKGVEHYFPRAIKEIRNFSNVNYHLLYDVCSAPKSHLEVVFIGTVETSVTPICDLCIQGRFLDGAGIEITDHAKKYVYQKCQGIIYRFIDVAYPLSSAYFKYPGILSYPNNRDLQTDPLELSSNKTHLLFMNLHGAFELTLAEGTSSISMELTREDMQKMAHALLQAIEQTSQ